MAKKFIFIYFFIFFTLLFVMSLSRPLTDKLRGTGVAFLTPMWKQLTEWRDVSSRASKGPHFPHPSGKVLTLQEENQRLALENQLLTNELQHALSLLKDKKIIETHLNVLNQAFNEEPSYIQKLSEQLHLKLHALPAKVIFRSLDLWNHSLWIDVGEADNRSDQEKCIVKNSPVLVGTSVVGVIDYVGQHQSRVRLITDNHLTPSVRVARGGMQDHFINEEISLLLHLLEHKKWLSHNEHVELQALLTKLQEVLKPFKKTWALAKGELQGSRSLSKQNGLPILKGSGFNYDFPDEEGEARDLRTGNLIHKSTSQAIALLQVGDLLITTGMDGVFPPGLKVATIAKIDLLKEGDYFYELEAIPTAGNLQDLSVVFVIPPVGYDPNDF